MKFIHQAPVVQSDKLLSADSVVCFVNTHPLESDLSGR